MALFFKTRKPQPTTPTPPPSHAAATPATGEIGLDPALEARIMEIGREYLKHSRGGGLAMLSSAFWSDKLMDWAMKDQAFKVQLFHFVDAFPTLKTPEQVHEHLVDCLTQPGVSPPPGLGVGLKAGGMFKSAMTKTMTSQIGSMASRFIAGTDAQSAIGVLRKLWDKDKAFTVNLLGEKTLTRAEVETYQQHYIDLINGLSDESSNWPEKQRLQSDHLGAIPRVNISIKVSALYPVPDPVNHDAVVERMLATVMPILDAAKQRNVHINFDIEQYELKDLFFNLFMKAAEATDISIGVVIQAYLRSAEADAQRLIDFTQRTGRQITIRLVKGAYWDYETIHADQMRWPVPVWSRKCDTDACFERISQMLIRNIPRTNDEGGTKLALGSHNVRSIATALAMVQQADLPKEALELQMLYGMADQLSAGAQKLDLRVREYVPIGEMIPGMAYLVRRLLENTSNESWLKMGFSDNAGIETLLASPHQPVDVDPGIEMIRTAPQRHQLSAAVPGVGDGQPFFNEPPRDFGDGAQRKAFANAVDAAEIVPAASTDDVSGIAQAAHEAATTWANRPIIERSQIVDAAGSELAIKRDAIAGAIVKAVDMKWREADSDVCAAIDACRLFARQAPALAGVTKYGQFIGELDQTISAPHGTVLVMASAYSPVGTFVQSIAAALVTGNTVLAWLPSSLGAIAPFISTAFANASLPDGTLQVIAGDAGLAQQLADHPAVAAVAGDVESITSTKPQLAQQAYGRSIVLIDASADLADAISGLKKAAFIHSGQAAGAAALAVVEPTHYDSFVERFAEVIGAMKLGRTSDPGTSIGPLFDAQAAMTYNQAMDAHAGDGRVVVERSAFAVPGEHADRYAAPCVVADVASDSALAALQVPGPYVAICKAQSFAHAVDVANHLGPRWGVSVFSRRPAHLTLAKQSLNAQRVFINQPSTGLRIGRQGQDAVLREFITSRVMIENTLRRGFAPGLEEGETPPS